MPDVGGWVVGSSRWQLPEQRAARSRRAELRTADTQTQPPCFRSSLPKHVLELSRGVHELWGTCQ